MISIKSLNAKVLGLSSLLIIFGFAGLFVANSYFQRQSTLAEVASNAKKFSDLLYMAIEEPMSLGDNNGTIAKFQTVRDRYNAADSDDEVEMEKICVMLTDHLGDVTYATDTNNVDNSVDALWTESPEAVALVKDALATDMSEGKLVQFGDRPVFVEVNTILNDEECKHCHGKVENHPILGAMVMAQDVTQQMHSLHMAQVKTGLISVGATLALIIALLLFMRYSILGPVKHISHVTSVIRKGNLDATFNVKGKDELHVLADDLQLMVNRIKDQLEYNKSILSGIIVPLLVAGTDHKIEFANKPILDILGKDEQHVLGKNIGEAFGSLETVPKIADAVVSSMKSESGSFSFTNGQNRKYLLHYEMSPLLGAQGQVVGIIDVLIDLTDEEKAKEHIRQQQQNLLHVAEQVTKASHTILDSSNTLTQRMLDLNIGTTDTVNKTEQAATAMEEMNASILEVANNASDTARATDTANESAREGGAVIQQTMDEIQGVSEVTEELSSTLNHLADQSNNISQVMVVINDIADQTNLLALNAAIEAARAGEAGRGFAVVSDEVRKLSEKTAAATKEVEAVIDQIQNSTKAAVKEMATARERVRSTAEMAQKAGAALTNIVEESNQIAKLIMTIAAAAEEQSAASDEITESVSQINELSGSISHEVDGASQAIQEVKTMAQHLSELVKEFSE